MTSKYQLKDNLDFLYKHLYNKLDSRVYLAPRNAEIAKWNAGDEVYSTSISFMTDMSADYLSDLLADIFDEVNCPLRLEEDEVKTFKDVLGKTEYMARSVLLAEEIEEDDEEGCFCLGFTMFYPKKATYHFGHLIMEMCASTY